MARNQRARWARQISAAWRASIEAIFECGRLLIAAKDALDHGEFTKMVERDLPFGKRTAQRLMAIARDTRLTNPTHASLLPQSWMTLYELTRLSDDYFATAIADGLGWCSNGDLHRNPSRRASSSRRRALLLAIVITDLTGRICASTLWWPS